MYKIHKTYARAWCKTSVTTFFILQVIMVFHKAHEMQGIPGYIKKILLLSKYLWTSWVIQIKK